MIKSKINNMAKDREYNKMIHTARWLRLRRDKLSAHPICEMCEEEGRVTAATEVHHIVPVEEALTRGEKEKLMFDGNNLKALCHDCHVQVHKELGSHSKAQVRGRAERQLKRFVKIFLK